LNANFDQVVRRWFVRVSAGASILLALNVALYIFGVARLGVLAAGEGEAAQREGVALAEREGKARAAASQVTTYHEGQKALETLAKDHFKTRSERLPEAQRALEEMVRSAGLTSEGYRYTYREIPDTKAKKPHWSRQYLEVEIAFRVSGSYPQVKRFLGDLQASPHFFLVDPPGIAASNQGAVLLTMNLVTRTYFLAGDGPAAPAQAAPNPGGQP